MNEESFMVDCWNDFYPVDVFIYKSLILSVYGVVDSSTLSGIARGVGAYPIVQ